VTRTNAPEQVGPAADLGRGLKARLVLVTPAVAEDWLKKNRENNRNVGRSRVRQYAADMKAGRWRLGDQAVSFDAEGRLVNGQHRLHACVLSGCAFWTVALWGLDADSFLVIDSGKKRSTDDAMKIGDVDAPSGCGATVRRVFLSHRTYAGRAFTDLEVAGFLSRHGASVAFAHRHLPRGKVCNASTRAAVCRAHAAGKSSRRLEDFCRVLSTGLMVPGDEAAVFLRNHVLEEAQQGAGRQRSKLYAVVEAALAAFLKGEAVKKLPAPAKAELLPLPDEGYWLDEEA
jgi:hypothetical protein